MTSSMLSSVAEKLMHPSENSLREALETVQASTGAARVSLAVFNDAEFEMVTFSGRSLLAPGVQLSCETSSLFATTRVNEIYVEDDFQKSHDFDRPVDRLMLASGFRSATSIPLAFGSDTVGALSLSSTSTGGLAEGPILELQSLGPLFCMALTGRNSWRPSRILICHDDYLVAGGVARLLERDLNVEVVIASSIDEAHAVEGHFDVVVSDAVVFGRALDALRQICPAVRTAPLVVLTSFDTPEHEIAATDAGARAYLTRDEAHRLPGLLSDMWSGSLPVPINTGGASHHNPLPRLTRRESDVLILLDEGLTVRQVARRLGVSETTTKSYVRGLFAKLDAHSRAQAVQVARRQGILQALLTSRHADELAGQRMAQDY